MLQTTVEQRRSVSVQKPGFEETRQAMPLCMNLSSPFAVAGRRCDKEAFAGFRILLTKQTLFNMTTKVEFSHDADSILNRCVAGYGCKVASSCFQA